MFIDPTRLQLGHRTMFVNVECPLFIYLTESSTVLCNTPNIRSTDEDEKLSKSHVCSTRYSDVMSRNLHMVLACSLPYREIKGSLTFSANTERFQ